LPALVHPYGRPVKQSIKRSRHHRRKALRPCSLINHSPEGDLTGAAPSGVAATARRGIVANSGPAAGPAVGDGLPGVHAPTAAWTRLVLRLLRWRLLLVLRLRVLWWRLLLVLRPLRRCLLVLRLRVLLLRLLVLLLLLLLLLLRLLLWRLLLLVASASAAAAAILLLLSMLVERIRRSTIATATAATAATLSPHGRHREAKVLGDRRRRGGGRGGRRRHQRRER
jgi:hypothetical protein